MLRLGSMIFGAGCGRPVAAWKLCDRDRIRITTDSYTGEGTVLRVDEMGLKRAIHWVGEGNVSGCWVVDFADEIDVIRGSLLWLR